MSNECRLDKESSVLGNYSGEIVGGGGPDPDPWHEPHNGLLPNEVPFRTDLTAEIGPVEDRLALPLARGGVAQVRAALIANVIYAELRSPETWLFYSRDRNHYAEQALARRYTSRCHTYANTMAAFESLSAVGLIEERRTVPSPTAKYRSRVRASASLLKSLEGVDLGFNVKPFEVIVLRDARGHPLDYRDTNRSCAWRDEVHLQNEFLASCEVRVDHPQALYDKNGFLRLGQRWLDPRRKHYRRIFSGDWSLGGRWYGPFWQSLPGEIRRHLRLNGEAVYEADYRACHLRLLCALAAIDLPFDQPGYDPYALPGLPRRSVKLAFQIMLNADTEASARAAVARKLHITHGAAATLIQQLQTHCPRLERFWCSGVGLKLQKFDAEICARVQRRLRGVGIPALSIHDSFVVTHRARSALENVMAEEMARACAALRK